MRLQKQRLQGGNNTPTHHRCNVPISKGQSKGFHQREQIPRNSNNGFNKTIARYNQFMEEPKEDRKAAVRSLLRYVAGTINYGLLYTDNGGELDLLGYSDSAMSGDVDGRKSTSGVIFSWEEIL